MKTKGYPTKLFDADEKNHTPPRFIEQRFTLLIYHVQCCYETLRRSIVAAVSGSGLDAATKNVPFKIQITVPGATNKIGSLHDSFLSKTKSRSGTVPVLEEDDGITLSESPAILTYLCEKHQWSDLYPNQPGTAHKALIDSYLHWHHENTRLIATLTMPYTRPDLNRTCTQEQESRVQSVLESLDQGWLANDAYIGGSDQASVADLLAYEEIAQASMTGVLDETISHSHPNLQAWMNRMEALPFHDAAHASLVALGNLKEPADDTPMMKRLGAATKEGMKALQDAQQTYVS